MNADAERPTRRQTYTFHGKSVYVPPGDTFKAHTTILAGVPTALADLSAYLPHRYSPLDDLHADTDVDRYAAVKALRFRDETRDRVIRALEDFIRREPEERVALGSGWIRRRSRLRIWSRPDRSFCLGQRRPTGTALDYRPPAPGPVIHFFSQNRFRSPRLGCKLSP